MYFSKTSLGILLLAIVAGSTTLHAEEKSMWQKFKDFFSPVPTVEGEGPEYDELRALDQEINKLEGKYSRERRPNNKQRIKKELDQLKSKREALAQKIKAKEAAAKNQPKPAPSSAKPQSSSSVTSSAATAVPVCGHDTVFVHDTVTVHDTLYVIVANPKATADSTQSNTAAEAPTVPGNK